MKRGVDQSGCRKHGSSTGEVGSSAEVRRKSPAPRPIAKRLLTLSLGALALLGCGNTEVFRNLQILSFKYEIRPLGDGQAFDDLIASVESGTQSVSSLFNTPCGFTADFDNDVLTPTLPLILSFGTPGQTGFNVSIIASNPRNLEGENHPACPKVSQAEIAIGSPSAPLGLGEESHLTNGRVDMVDGSFKFSRFFRATVQSFDATTHRSSGKYRFINRRDGDQPSGTLIVEGDYAMTP